MSRSSARDKEERGGIDPQGPIWRRVPPCHVLTFGVVSLLALALTLRTWVSLREHTVRSEGLVAQVAAATSIEVVKGSLYFVSPPRPSSLVAALTWYDLVFLGRENPSAPADLYRVAVRTIDGKRIFALHGLRNLTASPAGDEHALVGEGPVVAVATRALGQVRSLSVYDFSGAPRSNNGASLLGEAQTLITNFLHSGRARGVAKTTIRFKSAPQTVHLVLSHRWLTATWQDIHGRPGRSAVRLDHTAQKSGDLAVIPPVALAKRPLLWLVDTVRSLSFVGPGPIEWLEGRVFAFRDIYRRTHYQWFGEVEEAAVQRGADGFKDRPRLPAGMEIGSDHLAEIWPPPPFDPPVFKRRKGNEGIWREAAPDFVESLPNAPPAFVRTTVRPDEERPYVVVDLFAMDMRQLSLHMVGGIDDPMSTTGSAGTGRFPRHKEILERTVAAFNGAFKTEHGAYGMMVDKNVLLPPKEDAATVASLNDGTTAMGAWPVSAAIPANMSSLRQNMEPLIEDGVVNPRKRHLWGITLGKDLTRIYTVRSGLCISDKGYMVYAWGEDVSAKTLGVAMNAAGCVFGMHLDMNPYHTSFLFYRFGLPRPDARPVYQSELAIPKMMYSPHRYVNGASKDFFFLTLREPGPGPGWTANGLAQPAPAFVPALFGRKSEGCRLIAVDMSRATAHLAPGEFPADLGPADRPAAARVDVKDWLVDLSLGPWSASRGALANGAVVAALQTGGATMGVDDKGQVHINAWPLSRTGAIVENAVQGKWLTASSSESRITAVGIRGSFLIIGQGPADRLAALMKEERVEKPLFFDIAKAGSIDHAMAVRTGQGMVDLSSGQKAKADPTQARLMITAAPRPLGTRRLSAVFSAEPGQP